MTRACTSAGMPFSTILSRIVSCTSARNLSNDLLLGSDFLLQFEKRLGLEVAEGKILQFAAYQAHAETVGDRRVNIERLARDALLLRSARNSSVRMLCRRSASFTMTTRTSFTIASSILRTFSAWRASGASRSSRLIFVTPSTSRATSGPNCSEIFSSGNLRIFDDVVKQRGAQRGHVQLHVRQDMRHFNGWERYGSPESRV